jgi:microcystin-dependent protein
MAEAFIGEIRIWPSNRIPQGWALCNGALRSIADNQVLYSLIGNTYGGTQNVNFALPDLRGRLPIGQGQGPGMTMRKIGAAVGVSQVTLTEAQMPAHAHTFAAAKTAATTNDPTGAYLAEPGGTLYENGTAGGAASMHQFLPGSIDGAGASQPHDNHMPTFVLNYIICLKGLYPQPA